VPLPSNPTFTTALPAPGTSCTTSPGYTCVNAQLVANSDVAAATAAMQAVYPGWQS
jgi:hypothetical protein